MAKLALISLLFLAGCAHIKYGPVEYWRFGRQEVAYLHISEPNGLTLILRGYRGGENVKPSIEGVLFE